MDRLTKSAHFLPIKETYKLDKLADIYIREIVKLHGIPTSIVSNMDPRFISKFYKVFQQPFRPKLSFSTSSNG